MKIKVYTTPTCAYCPAVKKLLEKEGVEYKEVDVSEDEEALEEMKEETGQMGVPVTQIGDQFVIGFKKKKIKELIKNI